MFAGGTATVQVMNADGVDVGVPPHVSVVIPVFDRESTIELAVRSVLTQTETRIEVIVVDDGSTDGSLDAVRAIDDCRIVVVELGENRGANAARNAGIAVACGRWIAFQDSDDEWLPRKLELQLRALDAQPSAVAAWCAMVVVDSTVTTTSKFVAYLPTVAPVDLRDSFETHILKTSVVSNQTLLMDAATLRRIDGYDESLPALQDWELVIRLYREGKFVFVDEPLVIQRLSDDSITRSAEKRVRAREIILAKHEPLFAQHPHAYAANLYANAGAWRRLGDRQRAIGFLDRTLAIRPLSIRAHLMRTILRYPVVLAVVDTCDVMLGRHTTRRR